MTKARQAITKVAFVYEYAERYQELFPDVRSAGSVQVSAYEHAVGRQTQDETFDCQSGGSRCASAAPRARLCTLAGARAAQEASTLLRQALKERPFILCIDEAGDRKIGKTIDYIAHQYIGKPFASWRMASWIRSPFPCLQKVAEA